ncbi:MAG TPA: hypothetical protein VGU01_03830 [Sphingomicrobium sp.]|nr:hypothetical protein [Sphingomicrobium sp.]
MSNDSFDGVGEEGRGTTFARMDSVEYMLFESLVHHLIEKGLLTKNDALSVIEAVAQVVRGYTSYEDTAAQANKGLARLERTYLSFEALPDRSRTTSDAPNLTQLRPPVHRDRPKFPRED